ncbi:MAG: hypothetical protein LV481_04720 [Methylacidiphilales bacterium]|nr:hypothetical protein [Candidatus Methylacidiphilales bacterium]
MPPISSLRILYLGYSKGVGGIVAEMVRRSSDAYYCPMSPRNKIAVPEGMKLFGWAAAWKLRRALQNAEYDLVISCAATDPLWRHDQPWLKNILKVLKKVLFRPYSLGMDLVPWMMGPAKIPLVVFDWEDNTVIARKNWGLLQRATCYFKTQTPRNPYKAFLFQDKRNDCLFNILRQSSSREWVKKMRPCSLGVVVPKDWRSRLETPKTVDIFFAGAMHYSWVRHEGVPYLEALRDEGYKIDLHCITDGVQPLSHEEFLQRCSQAWLVWSPEGAGWDCVRHYWAPLMGSVPLLNHPDTRRYQPLIEGRHAFYYAVEGNDIQRVVREALRDKTRLRQMAAEGEALVLRYHTDVALVDYIARETLDAHNVRT